MPIVNKFTYEFKSLLFHTRDANCPIILESRIRLWMRPWSPETHFKKNVLKKYYLYSDSKVINKRKKIKLITITTDTHQILEKFPTWVKGSSAETGCCCQTSVDACSIPCKVKKKSLSITARDKYKKAKKEKWNKSTVTLEPEKRVLRIQMNWAAATAYLQHKDHCWWKQISVKICLK